VKYKIGLEIHVSLATQTKLFCRCATNQSQKPNSLVCPVCMGHPGTRLSVNKQAVIQGIAVCKALECSIASTLSFDRKTYFYPDMAKNFQITQYENPIGKEGKLLIQDNTIRISRVQLEEDPASIEYETDIQSAKQSLVDYNRAGRPLLEIVTQPDFDSTEQVRIFLEQLTSMLSYLGVREKHHVIKADLNVSIQETDYQRVEIKNVNGTSEIVSAIQKELLRQKLLHRKGEKITMQTRGWDGIKTFLLREKQSESDYGYIAEVNIQESQIDSELIQKASQLIPEFQSHKISRYIKEFGLDVQTAKVLTEDVAIASFFEEVCVEIDDAVFVAKWVRRELLKVLNYTKTTVQTSPISAQHVITILQLLSSDTISESTAQNLMELLSEENIDIHKYIDEHGLQQVTDTSQIRVWCKEILAENAQAVQDYQEGVEKSFHYLVGQVMRVSKGAAQPEQVRSILEDVLQEHI
jgi:aspartyl-tRNA(Asn)/glutamyl-tRNA(Gln) amidotransferase subunit B